MVEQLRSIGFGIILRAMFKMYPRRTVLGLTLMGSQAFLYNAIFFTYALVLTGFYNIDASRVPYYIFPFAIGNVLGPWLLGRLFDTIGRVPMISGCYFISGALLALTGYLFYLDILTAVTQTILWCIIFFFASAAASAGYLTVSEIFPMEIRAMAIAVFYSIAMALGGISGPIIFGELIGTGNPFNLFIGYLIAAGLMSFAAIVELLLGGESRGQVARRRGDAADGDRGRDRRRNRLQNLKNAKGSPREKTTSRGDRSEVGQFAHPKIVSRAHASALRTY
jgi:MFS family permease